MVRPGAILAAEGSLMCLWAALCGVVLAGEADAGTSYAQYCLRPAINAVRITADRWPL